MNKSLSSQLLAMSFDTETSPTIVLASGDSGSTQSEEGPTGWGFAWYPGDDRAAALIKDPIRTGPTAMSKLLHEWERFRGTQFVCHIRGAAKRSSEQDTQPFLRSYAGRDWVFAHNGDLERDYKDRLLFPVGSPFEAMGHTDSEYAFCWLLAMLNLRGARRLADVPWPDLHGLLQQIDAVGTANMIVGDGQDVVAYRDQDACNNLHYLRRIPPHSTEVHRNEFLELRLDRAIDETRSMVLVSSTPLSNDDWAALEPGQMMVARLATILWTSPTFKPLPAMDPIPPIPPIANTDQSQSQNQTQIHQGPERRRANTHPEGARVLSVFHETLYTYDAPIEKSSHLFRLRPVHDVNQEVLNFEFKMQPAQQQRPFEDVFGNQSMSVDIDQAYTELRLTAISRVLVHPPISLSSPTRRSSIPMVWMPWQRQMMTPYLLPPELPETQLRELSDFAMSFVERQDYNLINTLVDMNETIFRDFAYVSGSTTLETTPFDVYSQRRGVCQDFANLFICMARLLAVPARYRVGYIYTGGYENKAQSDASHAWAEVYLPWLGWLGFDPTNGVVAGLDHVRVACGRNYRDAAPTSGTIFRGGGTETLAVNVRVEFDDRTQ